MSSGLRFACLVMLSVIVLSGSRANSGFVGSRDAIGGRLLVFVHGWGGVGTTVAGQRTTWTSPETNAYWPDLIKSDPELGKVDVYVHDYGSGCGSDRPIVDLAADLRKRLDEPAEAGGAEIESYKEVIFVAHSIGGLIVREAVSLGRRHHEKIAGLFLFASPMSGTVMAQYARVACGGSIIRELAAAKSAGSYLSQLSDRWVTSRPAIQINSWCATANEDGVVPDENSARLLCNRAIRSMAAGHIDLVKPSSVNHPSHELLKSWMRDVFPDLYAQITETSRDIVVANCGESYYSSILQAAILNVASRRNRRVRLSSILPIDYREFSSESLWKTTEPAVLVIHLSCFQRRWEETEESAIQRTRDLISLLARLEANKVKVIVYSKAFSGNGFPEFFSSEDRDGSAMRMHRESRLYFVQVGTGSRPDRQGRTKEQQFVQSDAQAFAMELARALPTGSRQ